MDQSQETKEVLQSPPPKRAEVTWLFESCFRIPRIDTDSNVPAITTDKSEVKALVVADYDSFEEFLKIVREDSKVHDRGVVRKILDKNGATEVDEETFCLLLSFSRQFDQRYHFNPDEDDSRRREESRKELYKREEISLSEIFSNDIEQCAEIAILAQGFLQQVGVNSSYIAGECVEELSEGENYSTGHSFIVVRDKERSYIFDPANTVRANGKVYPAVYISDNDFDAETSQHRTRFIRGRNIIDGNTKYFGVGNSNRCIVPAKDVA